MRTVCLPRRVNTTESVFPKKQTQDQRTSGRQPALALLDPLAHKEKQMKTNRGTIAAFAVGALLISLVTFVPTAAAEVVYTPVNVTISGNGYIKIDLNH